MLFSCSVFLIWAVYMEKLFIRISFSVKPKTEKNFMKCTLINEVVVSELYFYGF